MIAASISTTSGVVEIQTPSSFSSNPSLHEHSPMVPSSLREQFEDDSPSVSVPRSASVGVVSSRSVSSGRLRLWSSSIDESSLNTDASSSSGSSSNGFSASHSAVSSFH